MTAPATRKRTPKPPAKPEAPPDSPELAELRAECAPFELKPGESPWDWKQPVFLADPWDTALADLDMAYRKARVEMHGDCERAHERVLKGTLTPCWERPEFAGLGDTGPQPAAHAAAGDGLMRRAAALLAKMTPQPPAAGQPPILDTLPAADIAISFSQARKIAPLPPMDDPVTGDMPADVDERAERWAAGDGETADSPDESTDGPQPVQDEPHEPALDKRTEGESGDE